ncbi:MAG: mechanosensitive ion channel family protein [Bacteroidetes bacterium]|nr:MAG: mechanosensitive ion channel family protein [Bacteroidota bacterium]
MQEFLRQEHWGNTYLGIGSFILILLIGWFLRKTVSRFLSHFLYRFFKKFSDGLGHDEFIDLLKKPIQLIILLFSIYLAIIQLEYPDIWGLTQEEMEGYDRVLRRFYGTFMAIALTWLMLRLVDYIIMVLYKRAQETEDTSDDQIILFMKDLIKVIVVILAIFFVLSAIFKLNITSLIAGLGIGGLAVALAAQETLSNLLGSFIIFLDKPFKTGDTVSFDNITGTIEKVGFRSTQVRTLDKSLLTVPNKNLIDGPLNNITLSPFRRVKFVVGLTYGTKSAQIKKIIDEISDVLKNHQETKDDYTVAFTDFGAYSMDITVIFFVYSNDWNKMVSVKEEINFKIMEIVELNGCDFAFPTQTIHVEKGS